MTDPELDAIVVSRETEGGAEAVNAARRERGMRALEFWSIGLIEESGSEGKSVAVSEKMSSSQIRAWLAEAANRL